MPTHSHHHHQAVPGHDDTALADLLDLDAEVLGPYLDQVTEWVGQLASDVPRTVVDVGAGTGTGSLALARRFGTAVVVAIDRSPLMLERIREAAHGQGLQGLEERLRLVQADLDVAWPEVGAVDLVWAASSLHELAHPGRVLDDIYTALNPGGLLVVIEMAGPPRFLPDDLGRGRPGLESRCHEALARLGRNPGWNPHPNWRPHLERAGFEIAAQRTFTIEETPAPPSTGRYAQAHLSRIRSALDGELAKEDLDTLDHLLADGGPDALRRRSDLRVRGRRTAWAARRPELA
ncbi:MAG: class I SAM-dependent methyltransferase [Candidatus Dormibacteraceae bacterium]